MSEPSLDLDPRDDADPVDVAPEADGGRVVVLLGAKGGCGTSLLAANLAVAAAARRLTCVLDLDVGKGDLATYLDLEPGPAAGPLLARLAELDGAMLVSALRPHPSGVRALLQPDALDQLHRLGADDVRRLLHVARALHAVTVVDAGSRVDVHALSAALAADVVVIVATAGVPALRDARRLVALLARLRVPASRLRVVINRAPRGGLDAVAVGAELGVPVVALLPRDDEACAIVDERGVPLADVGRPSELRRALAGLLSDLLDEPAEVAPPRAVGPSLAAAFTLVPSLLAWRTR